MHNRFKHWQMLQHAIPQLHSNTSFCAEGHCLLYSLHGKGIYPHEIITLHIHLIGFYMLATYVHSKFSTLLLRTTQLHNGIGSKRLVQCYIAIYNFKRRFQIQGLVNCLYICYIAKVPSVECYIYVDIATYMYIATQG